jgi:hypothetical protein
VERQTLVVEVVDQHLKVLHLLLPAAMAAVDLQSLDGQDRQLLDHQQWKHCMSQVAEAVEAETFTVLEAVLVVLFITQQCH